MFTQRQLQYSETHSQCLHRCAVGGTGRDRCTACPSDSLACRTVNPGTNDSSYDFWTYGIETAFHEMLLQSRHRTFDAEEADLFYIPAYLGCYAWPIHGWSRFPYFTPQGSHAPRKSRRG